MLKHSNWVIFLRLRDDMQTKEQTMAKILIWGEVISEIKYFIYYLELGIVFNTLIIFFKNQVYMLFHHNQ